MVSTGIPSGLLGAYVSAEAILYFDLDTISKTILDMLSIGVVLLFAPKKKKDQEENKPSNKKVILFGATAAVFVIGSSSPLHSSNNINGNRIKSTEYSLIDLRVI